MTVPRDDVGLTRAVFRRAAGRYDSRTELHRRIAEALVDFWVPPLPPGGGFADLGAGTGAAGRAVCSRRGTEPSLSLDLSPRMCAGTPRAVCADLRALPLRTACLDAAVSSMALHWAEPIEDALREITRTLKPGGMLVYAVPVAGSLQEYIEVKERAFPLAPRFLFPESEALDAAEQACGLRPDKREIRDFVRETLCARDLLDAPRGSGGAARGSGPWPGRQALARFESAYEALPPERRLLRWRVRLCAAVKD